MWTKGGSGVVRMTVAGRRKPEREEFVQVVGINVWFCDKNSPSSMAPKTGSRFHQITGLGGLSGKRGATDHKRGHAAGVKGTEGGQTYRT